MRTFSSAKVEKVVKPPQNPVTNKSRIFSSKNEYLNDNPINNPIIKQPVILIINVAQGKGPCEKGIREMRNLNILPMAPPTPTKINCFIIILFLTSQNRHYSHPRKSVLKIHPNPSVLSSSVARTLFPYRRIRSFFADLESHTVPEE